MGKPWNLDAVRNMRSRYRIPRTAPSLPTATPLPDRREDGSYSVLGAARHFGVSRDVIRRWIENGLIQVSRHNGRSRAALWLHIKRADLGQRWGFTSTNRPKAVWGRRPPSARRSTLPSNARPCGPFVTLQGQTSTRSGSRPARSARHDRACLALYVSPEEIV